ncbi:hypothetical protein D9M68_928550 [compost metagenome]
MPGQAGLGVTGQHGRFHPGCAADHGGLTREDARMGAARGIHQRRGEVTAGHVLGQRAGHIGARQFGQIGHREFREVFHGLQA